MPVHAPVCALLTCVRACTQASWAPSTARAPAFADAQARTDPITDADAAPFAISRPRISAAKRSASISGVLRCVCAAQGRGPAARELRAHNTCAQADVGVRGRPVGDFRRLCLGGLRRSRRRRGPVARATNEREGEGRAVGHAAVSLASQRIARSAHTQRGSRPQVSQCERRAHVARRGRGRATQAGPSVCPTARAHEHPRTHPRAHTRPHTRPHTHTPAGARAGGGSAREGPRERARKPRAPGRRTAQQRAAPTAPALRRNRGAALFVCAHSQLCARVWLIVWPLRARAGGLTRTDTRARAHTHTRTHTHTRARAHTHTHMHTRAQEVSQLRLEVVELRNHSRIAKSDMHMVLPRAPTHVCCARPPAPCAPWAARRWRSGSRGCCARRRRWRAASPRCACMVMAGFSVVGDRQASMCRLECRASVAGREQRCP
jgi:hypothetical protein